MDAAPFVLIAAVTVAMIASAISVFASWRAYEAAKSLRSMTSLQGELLEIRDYIAKVDAWAKRINAREVMNERKDPETGFPRSAAARAAQTDLKHETDKAKLRRALGIVPGKPLPHA